MNRATLFRSNNFDWGDFLDDFRCDKVLCVFFASRCGSLRYCETFLSRAFCELPAKNCYFDSE